MIGMMNRVHTFARLENEEKLTRFFTDILDCELVALPGSVLAFRFPNGASLSVEFTEDALDEKQAWRGAWLEARTEDPSDLKKKVLAAAPCPQQEPPHNPLQFS